jgi:Flp pilus assembly pilin Flp
MWKSRRLSFVLIAPEQAQTPTSAQSPDQQCKTPATDSRSERGQSLVEYLILVALMGVASIAVIRVLSQTVNSQFATAANALRGSPKKISASAPDASSYKKKDLSNFIDGVAARSRGSDSGSAGGESE